MLNYNTTHIYFMTMKRMTIGLAAIGAVFLIGSCSKKKEPAKLGSEANFEMQIESLASPVAKDTVVTSNQTLGSKTVAVTKIDRIFKGENPEIYYSVVASVPDKYPAVSAYVADKTAGLYAFVTDTDTVASKVGSAAELTNAIDALGNNFMTAIAPVYQSSVMPVFNLTTSLQPYYATDAYVTYSVFDTYFTGGAHGMTDYYFETVDPANGEVITIDGIIKPEKMGDFRKLLVETMASAEGETVDEYIKSVNDYVMPTAGNEITIENFPIYNAGIIEDGIVVVYPSYSIAPYSDGMPSYILPTASVKDMLAI